LVFTGLSAHLSSPYNSTTTSWLEALHDSSLDHYDNITTNASMFVGYASGGNVTIRLISNADGVWGRAFQVCSRFDDQTVVITQPAVEGYPPAYSTTYA
jgi:hypothetical protein